MQAQQSDYYAARGWGGGALGAQALVPRLRRAAPEVQRTVSWEIQKQAEKNRQSVAGGED